MGMESSGRSGVGRAQVKDFYLAVGVIRAEENCNFSENYTFKGTTNFVRLLKFSTSKRIVFQLLQQAEKSPSGVGRQRGQLFRDLVGHQQGIATTHAA